MHPLEISIVLTWSKNITSIYIISFLSTLHKQDEPTNRLSPGRICPSLCPHLMETKQYYVWSITAPWVTERPRSGEWRRAALSFSARRLRWGCRRRAWLSSPSLGSCRKGSWGWSRWSRPCWSSCRKQPAVASFSILVTSSAILSKWLIVHEQMQITEAWHQLPPLRRIAWSRSRWSPILRSA